MRRTPRTQYTSYYLGLCSATLYRRWMADQQWGACTDEKFALQPSCIAPDFSMNASVVLPWTSQATFMAEASVGTQIINDDFLSRFRLQLRALSLSGGHEHEKRGWPRIVVLHIGARSIKIWQHPLSKARSRHDRMRLLRGMELTARVHRQRYKQAREGVWASVSPLGPTWQSREGVQEARQWEGETEGVGSTWRWERGAAELIGWWGYLSALTCPRLARRGARQRIAGPRG